VGGLGPLNIGLSVVLHVFVIFICKGFFFNAQYNEFPEFSSYKKRDVNPK
jgi:hypothetical protein